MFIDCMHGGGQNVIIIIPSEPKKDCSSTSCGVAGWGGSNWKNSHAEKGAGRWACDE